MCSTCDENCTHVCRTCTMAIVKSSLKNNAFDSMCSNNSTFHLLCRRHYTLLVNPQTDAKSTTLPDQKRTKCRSLKWKMKKF